MDGPQITRETIGEAWLAVAERILDAGTDSLYDARPILDLERVSLRVDAPASTDAIVARLGDPERLAWMHANFSDHRRVAELGDARSYASRLYDYGASGRDQIAWVIERLSADPSSRSATITTFEPLLDSSYIPCVSLLDFWVRDGGGDARDPVDLIVYAHSIDFGTKGYGNLVEIAFLMERVGAGLGRPVGRLDFIIKSAHIYAPEQPVMRGLTSDLATEI
jgi:thymidylate synthase